MVTMPKPLTERQQYWLGHIKAADASGGSCVEYATVHDLDVKHLYQWKTTLRRQGLLPGTAPTSSFVAVTPSSVSIAPINCILNLPNGIRVQIAGSLDASVLGQILSVAHGLS